MYLNWIAKIVVVTSTNNILLCSKKIAKKKTDLFRKKDIEKLKKIYDILKLREVL